MLLTKEEYEPLYWVTYYYVRKKYFPGPKWHGKFPDRSPLMWERDLIGGKEKLGKEVFKTRGVRYIYLALTYFSDTLVVQDIDDNVLAVAFELVGCKISAAERRKQRLVLRDANKLSYEIFKKRKEKFLTEFPELADIFSSTKVFEIIDQQVDKSKNQFGQNSIDLSFERIGEIADQISKDTVERKLDEKRRFMFDTDANEQAFRGLIVDYFNYLKGRKYDLAMLCWDASTAEEVWGQNFNKFALQFSDVKDLLYFAVVSCNIRWWFNNDILNVQSIYDPSVEYHYDGYGIVAYQISDFSSEFPYSLKISRIYGVNDCGCWCISKVEDLYTGVNYAESNFW